jgi:TatD DNase family protein
MTLIDTHTHLYLPEFDTDRDEMIRRASASGIEKMLMPNIDFSSVKPMLDATDRYPGVCLPMTGLHPTSVKENYREELEKIENLPARNDYVAVGETGIDLYWDKTHLHEQKETFRWHIERSLSSSLPLVIHSRDSFNEVVQVLKEYRGKPLRGVFHAFSGNWDDALIALNMNFFLGIGGPVTFKNSKLPEIIKKAGLEHVILETDSPYLAPVPHRGSRNESSYLILVNTKIAEVLGIKEDECAERTYLNSCNLFGLK